MLAAIANKVLPRDWVQWNLHNHAKDRNRQHQVMAGSWCHIQDLRLHARGWMEKLLPREQAQDRRPVHFPHRGDYAMACHYQAL